MKNLIVSDHDFKRLQEGKHICTNAINRFIAVKCINEITKEELFADVSQVGGIWNYKAAIRRSYNSHG